MAKAIENEQRVRVWREEATLCAALRSAWTVCYALSFVHVAQAHP